MEKCIGIHIEIIHNKTKGFFEIFEIILPPACKFQSELAGSIEIPLMKYVYKEQLRCDRWRILSLKRGMSYSGDVHMYA